MTVAETSPRLSGDRAPGGGSASPRNPGRLSAGALLLLVSLATPGCLNFQEPEELGPRRGELAVQLLVSDTLPTSADLQGRFTRERLEDGTYRPLADSTIRVLGRAVAPDSSVEPGFLFYGDEWLVPEDERPAPGLELRGPLPGDGGSRVSVAFPFVSRAGPDSVVLRQDEDLHLPVDPGEEDLYENVAFMSWTLVVEREGSETSLFSLRAAGRPPDTLRIQRELLAPAAGEPERTVTFWVRMDAGPPEEALPYDLRFGLTTVLEWTVVMEE